VNASSGPVRVTLQLAVETADELPDEQVFTAWVNTALSEALNKVPDQGRTDLPENTCVTIRIVSSAESSELNSSFRDIHRPTNVLAFPAGINTLPEEADHEVELGDLVICYDVVISEAEQQQKTLCAHMAHLTVHGALHLVGFDHHEDAAANIMESLEAHVLGILGFKDPYLNDDQDMLGA
jgi:probable rRNA maturation factor